MTKRKKVSVQETADGLAIWLDGIGSDRRFLLIGGFKEEKELVKFISSVKVPGELVPKMVGSTRGYTDLELVIPGGTSFYVVKFCGSADLMWKIHADAALAAGYPIADVRDDQIRIHGRENEPIPVSACTGVLHNVYADSL